MFQGDGGIGILQTVIFPTDSSLGAVQIERCANLKSMLICQLQRRFQFRSIENVNRRAEILLATGVDRCLPEISGDEQKPIGLNDSSHLSKKCRQTYAMLKHAQAGDGIELFVGKASARD